MENYREKLKIQNLTFGICAFVLALFCFLSAAGEAGIIPFFVPAGDSHWQSMWRGFISGASFALLTFMIIGLVRNIRAMKDEKALKKLFIKDHDERTIQVWTSARAAAFQTFLLLGLVAIIVSGYFSMTVSVTIMACVVAASLLGLSFKLYYNNKY